MQLATPALVGPDIAIDRLVTDRQQAGLPEHRGDLLRAPFEGEPRRHQRELGRREPLAAPTAPPAGVGPLLSHRGAVAAIGAGVAGELPPDRAAMPAQRPRDVGGAKPESPQQPEGISFVYGDL